MAAGETLAEQEFDLSGNGITDPRDPLWTKTVRLFMQRNKSYRRARDQTRQGIALIAAIFWREQSRWQQFQTDHGIDGPQRGPVSHSIFHPICRYLLGLGIGGDTDGTAVVMAAVLDQWHEDRETISPDQIPAWIKKRGGVRRIYDERRQRHDDYPAQTSPPLIRHVVNDLVYTEADLARRLIDHFRPTGRILDPCRGDGAFYDNFPETRYWCEIRDGRDFLTCNELFDWIMTNLPWSKKLYRAISQHAFEIAENVVFLARLHNAIGTYARHRDWRSRGHGLREIIILNWQDAGLRAEGFVLGAFHWQRGWIDSTKFTYWI
jgi:hypothetical protein